MGKIIVTEFVTLDGVAQSPGGPDEDSGGFEHGGWQIRFFNQAAAAKGFEKAKQMDALLLGRRTYEMFAEYFPTAPTEIPFTDLFNDVPKYVASRTLVDPLDWAGSTVLDGPIHESVAALRQRYDEIHVIGSLDLVQSLLRFGLIDRFELLVYPILLGSGKRVFANGTVPTDLSLIESTIHPNGSLQLTYDTDREPNR